MYRRYMTLTELADYIGLSVKTLRNWKTNSPEKLPPHIDLTFDSKHDIWRFDSVVVDEWMAEKNTGRQGRKPLIFDIAQ